jgi:peroxiredoxin
MRFLSIIILATAFAIPTLAQTALKPGNSAPTFTAESLDGSYFDLSSMRGTVVVMTFWSTKCEICRSEIPKLNNFTSRYDESKVVFLALTNENEDRVGAFLKGNPFKFHVLPNSFGVVLQYADRDKQGNIDFAYPSYFLIDQTGNIAYRSYGWDKTGELESRISKLIASN